MPTTKDLIGDAAHHSTPVAKALMSAVHKLQDFPVGVQILAAAALYVTLCEATDTEYSRAIGIAKNMMEHGNNPEFSGVWRYAMHELRY